MSHGGSLIPSHKERQMKAKVLLFVLLALAIFVPRASQAQTNGTTILWYPDGRGGFSGQTIRIAPPRFGSNSTSYGSSGDNPNFGAVARDVTGQLANLAETKTVVNGQVAMSYNDNATALEIQRLQARNAQLMAQLGAKTVQEMDTNTSGIVPATEYRATTETASSESSTTQSKPVQWESKVEAKNVYYFAPTNTTGTTIVFFVDERPQDQLIPPNQMVGYKSSNPVGLIFSAQRVDTQQKNNIVDVDLYPLKVRRGGIIDLTIEGEKEPVQALQLFIEEPVRPTKAVK